MEQKQNKYSIRKFTFGASSILVGSLLFLGVGTAQAEAESNTKDATEYQINEHQLSNDQHNEDDTANTSVELDKTQRTDDTDTIDKSLHNDQQDRLQQEEVDPEYNEQDKAEQEEVDPEYNEKDKAEQEEVDPEYNEKDKAEQEEVDPEYNEKDKAEQEEVDPEYNEKDKAEQEEVDPEYNEKDKAEQEEVDPEYNEKDKAEQEEVDPEYNEKDKAEQEEVDPEYNEKDKAEQEEVDPEYNEQDKAEQDKAEQDKAEQENAEQKLTEKSDTATLENNQSDESNISLDKLKDESTTKETDDDERKDDPDKTLESLKESTVATTNNQNNKSTVRAADQPNKVAKQNQYKNKEPIILVHGFNGFTDDISPSILPHYWGGEKLDIRQNLEQNGYEAYEASVGAISSNHDRAIELYYYIKGGTVDYGAAHAEKYGHERYGKTYEGVYKDWQPGQKVHLVGHSMGGQTIRLMEEYLRNGNQEEIEYQKKHGGEISPLFAGNNDNMISSITTLATPHNGTHASDNLGNEALIRQGVFDYAKLKGNKNSKVDFGLSQWGFKQKPNESYIEYVKRVKDSKLWQTNDNGFYDLTRAGAAELNNKTSLNPNIVYKTYTGESTRSSLLGKQKSDINMYFPMTATGNIIGKAPEKDWRINDGLVSIISSQHPFNQKSVLASDQIRKGVWQVTPVMYNWDHADFVGQDKNDRNRSAGELSQFYLNIASDLVRNEELGS